MLVKALRFAVLCALAAFAGASTPLTAQPPAPAHWVGSWATSQLDPGPQNSMPPGLLRDATLRQVVHLSLGGGSIRLRLSNAFGTTPLHIAAIHIARPKSPATSAIDPRTDTVVHFGGAADVMIPAGADYVSDPVTFTAAPLSDLGISLYFDEPPAQQTGHPDSQATSYLVRGNAVSAPDLDHPIAGEHWYWIAGVDVVAAQNARAIVALGDSITDGHGSTSNGNDRWPDELARRLQANAATRSVGVLNQGISGNRLLLDTPNGVARIDRDIFGQANVRYLILLEGINDLGMLTHTGAVPQPQSDALIRNLLAAYQQIITRSHDHGIFVIGATITPDGNSGYGIGPQSEAARQALNRWIRTPGHFDAVVDFDQAIRDPAHPDRMLPAYDCGDHLHPSPAGYKAMAADIPLTLFEK